MILGLPGFISEAIQQPGTIWSLVLKRLKILYVTSLVWMERLFFNILSISFQFQFQYVDSPSLKFELKWKCLEKSQISTKEKKKSRKKAQISMCNSDHPSAFPHLPLFWVIFLGSSPSRATTSRPCAPLTPSIGPFRRRPRRRVA